VLTLEFDKNNALTKKLRNSSANDEGRALAARWRPKMCHGGFNTAVSHLFISVPITGCLKIFSSLWHFGDFILFS